jgi:20S proteasome alpha/beta subunit
LEGQHRSDGSIAKGNDITKLSVSGEFAWAFSGGYLAQVLSGHLSARAAEMRGLKDEELMEFFKECCSSAFEQRDKSGPDSTSRVLFVRGSNKSIFKINPVPHTDIEKIGGGRAIAGQITNTASFLFHRIYSAEMSVKELAELAAYSVHAASSFDSSVIDGLDIAVYQEREPLFKFIDTNAFMNCLPEIDKEIRKVFARFMTP